MGQELKKKAKLQRPIEMVITLRPGGLKVDKAIIFRSYTKLTPRTAVNIFNPHVSNRITFDSGLRKVRSSF